jgi:predicted enzyme related to lactoylglutathione lyase
MSTTKKGRFVWYDLMTTDPETAQRFYSELFGWDMMPYEGSEKPYTIVVNREVAIGGISEIPQEALDKGAPPYWMTYLHTPDLQVAVDRAANKGAQILVPPTDVPGQGAFSVLLDVQGALVAFYREDKSPAGRIDEPRTGDVSWNELLTTDWKAAFAFYTDLFDWEDAGEEDMGPMGIYKMFVGGEVSRGGVYNKPPQMEGPPTWLFYFMVEDVEQAVDTVRSLGGSVMAGPMEVPGGDTVATCMDPQGGTFALHAKKTG